MNLQPQLLVEQLVRQHDAALARLHADLRDAVSESASRWADRFPNPADMGGQTRCTTVRQTLLHMDASRPATPRPTITMSEGLGMSVVLKDPAGHVVRVRKYPSYVLGKRTRAIQTPLSGLREAAAWARQMALDEGLDEPVFVRDPTTLPYDLFVLWQLDQGEMQLGSAELVAVVAIDDSKNVRLLASAPLPAPVPFTAPADPMAGDQTVMDDFDEFDHGAEETGNDPA
ncbi:hypothetical protein J2W56_002687 [Nocardia kruczakiae]|uniref:Phage protein n=1 Tax=Nocardia kruczakiae TaxID=261477 RepID=A0ABU1XEH3_9NOCA|nr:hypothetical protein [Nocardia kruczakiae]MDR7168946.1 hypothetical protein [Nocardia kruczakiae]